eukprot:UN30975
MTHFEIDGVDLDYDQLYLLGRAKTKFDEFDIDASGSLGSDETLLLADWVWNNFEPDGAPLSQKQRLEVANKLIEKYDDNGDGTLDFPEFVDWFLETAAILKDRQRDREIADNDGLYYENDDQTPEQIIDRLYHKGDALTLREAIRKARLKYEELDLNKSGLLEESEVADIAEWALATFNPGKKPISDYERAEFCNKLKKLADTNGDKKIDFDEFSDWFVESLCDITKANNLLGEFGELSSKQNITSLSKTGKTFDHRGSSFKSPNKI